MPDSVKNRGKGDRIRVSQQKHELRYEARKTDMPAALVKKIVQSNGPMRKDVEGKLGRMKESARRR